MRVTVDRISQSGNPIANEQDGDKHIHVPDGEVGETYEVELFYGSSAHLIGIREGLSPDQKKEYNYKYTETEREELEKSNHGTNPQLPKGVDSQGMKITESQESDTDITEGNSSEMVNKNHLLNGKL